MKPFNLRTQLGILLAILPSLVLAQPVINEFVISHGTSGSLTVADSAEFVEVFGVPSASPGAYWLLIVDGDRTSGGNPGRVDFAVQLTAPDADGGYWMFGLDATNNNADTLATESLPNGTQTFMLVTNFTGTAGLTDIDFNNDTIRGDYDNDGDGTVDAGAPWDAIIDEVSISDGGKVDVMYAATELEPGFDGDFIGVVGASRIPNGTDTDAVGDWVRNDFDGAGLAPFNINGNPADNRAFNTPGAENVFNRPPTANDFAVDVDEDSTANAIDIFANVDDPDLTGPNGTGDTLTITSVGATSGGGSAVINDNGTPGDPTDDFVEYTPAADFFGSETFTYTVEDQIGSSDSGTVTVNVANVNDDPTANDDSPAAFDEDSGAQTFDVLANDTIAPDVGETLTITATSTPGKGSVSIISAGTELSYTPDEDANGADTFTYTISDGNGGSDTATVNVTINPVADAPDAFDDAVTSDEDSVLNGDLFADNGNGADKDDDGDAINVVSVNTGATTGSVTITTPGAANDGSFTYDPNGQFEFLAAGESDTDSFSYTISDGDGTTADASATVTVTITGVNDNPTANDDNFVVNEGENVSDNVLANDDEPDTNDTITVVGNTDPANGTLTVSANGDFTYTHDGSETSTDSFTYTIEDGSGATSTATVDIAINAVNDVPVAEVATPVNAEQIVGGTPTLTFSVTDDDDDPIGYEVEVATDAGFSSTVLSFRSNRSFTEGAPIEFTVGQDGTNGAYSLGSAGMNLDTGTYFWRVLGYDDEVDGSFDADGPDPDNFPASFEVIVPEVSISGDGTIAEAGPTTSQTVTVTLSGASNDEITVDLALTGDAERDGSDFTLGNLSAGVSRTDADTVTVVFSAGDTSKSFDVDVVSPDSLVEGDENVVFTIQADGGAPASYSVNADADAEITIIDQDDDAATFTATPVNTDVDESDVASGSYTVELNLEPESPVTVTITNPNPADLSGPVDQATVVLDSGNYTGVTVNLVGASDSLVEGEETVTLTHAIDTALYANSGNDITATIDDADDDGATLIATSPVDVTEGSTESYTLTLSAEPQSPVTVTITNPSTADLSAPVDQDTVQLDSGNWNTGVDVDVTAIADSLVEGDETFSITHALSTALYATASTTVNITDGDTDGVVQVSPNTEIEVTEDGATASYTITLSKEPGAGVSVTVDITNAGAGDVNLDESQVTLDDINWDTGVEVTASAVDDNLLEGDESFDVTHSESSALYALDTDTTVEVDVVDNDSTTLSIATGSNASEPGTDGSFTLSLSDGVVLQDALNINLSFTGGATPGTDYTQIPGIFSFPDNQASATITVEVIDDDIVEDGGETVVATIDSTLDTTGLLSIAGGPDDSATVTIADEDTAVVSIAGTADATEGGGNGSITFNLSNAVSESVTVDLSFAGSEASPVDDFGLAPASTNFPTSITIPPNLLAHTVTVVAEDDDLVEGTEGVAVAITADDNGSVTVDGSVAGFDIIDNDTATVAISASATPALEEGEVDGEFTVTLSKTVPEAVTFSYSVDGASTAESGDDYAALSGSVTIPANTLSATIAVDVVDDNLVEIDSETIVVNIDSDDSGLVDDTPTQASATVAITDNDSATVTVDDISDNEENGPFGFTVTLDTPVEGGLTVTVATSPGTAEGAGVDYVTTSVDLTFDEDGSNLSQAFSVSITDDNALEADEQFGVTLSNPVAAAANTGDVDVSDTGAGTIVNTDTVEIAITPADGPSAAEGSSGAPGILTFDVTLVAPGTVQGGFTVAVSTADDDALAGSDYTTASDSFAHGGASGLIGQLTVNFIGDSVMEPGSESFAVNVGAITNLAAGISESSINKTDSEGDILDDDNATISVTAASQDEGDTADGDTAFDVTITSDIGIQDAVSFDVSTVDGTATTADSDYTDTTDTLTLSGPAPSDTFSFNVTGDDKIEDNETVTINLNSGNFLPPAGYTASRFTFTDDDVTIDNDDTATLTVDDVTLAEGDDPGTTDFTFTVTLDELVDGGLTVDLAVAPSGTHEAATPADFTTTVGTVTFAGDTLNDTQSFTVSVVGDDALENDETFEVSISDVTDGSDAALPTAVENALDDTDTGTGTITNDDSVTVTVETLSVVEGDTGNDIGASVDVSLDGQVNDADGFAVEVTVTATGTTTAGVDYTVSSPATLNFPGTADGTDTQTFTVTVIGDDLVEPDSETISMEITNVTGLDVPALVEQDGVLTITDNDTTSLTIVGGSVNEPDTGSAGLNFTLTLTNPVQGGLSIDVDTADDTATVADGDYSATNVARSFNLTTTNQQATVTVDVLGDTTVEPDEDFTAGLSGLTVDASINTADITVGGAATGTITNEDTAVISIVDNDVVEPDGSATTSLVFTVNISAPVQGGVTVAFSTQEDSATEDTDYVGSSGSVSFGDDSTDAQTFSVTINGDDLVESDETFDLLLGSISGLTGGIDPGDVTAGPDGVGTITDNDTAELIITASTQASEESPTDGLFTVSIENGKQFASATTVSLSLDGATEAERPSDYSFSPAPLTDNGTDLTYDFPADSDSFTITVDVVDDLVAEDSEDIILNLNDTGDYDLGTTTSATVSIADDDDLYVRIEGATDAAEDDDGTDRTDGVFTVSLVRQDEGPGATTAEDDITVAYSLAGTATDGGVDYTDTDDGSVTIFAGTTSTTITLAVVEDNLEEGNETIEATLGVSSTTGGFTVATAPSPDDVAEINLLDDDTEPFVQPGDEIADQDYEEDSGSHTIDLTGLFTDVNDRVAPEVQSGSDGFGAWTIATSGTAGTFTDASAAGNSDIGNPVFGFFANAGGSVTATYAFDESDGALKIGQTFSLRMDNHLVDVGARVGFRLLDASDAEVLLFQFTGGDLNYEIEDNGGVTDTGVGFTQDGLDIAITRDSATDYTLWVDGINILSGTLAASGEVTQVELFNAGSGGGDTENLYFNDVTISPAPITVQTNSNPGLFADVTIDGFDLTVELAADQNGTADLTLAFTSNGAFPTQTATDTFTIDVDNANDAPVNTDPGSVNLATDEDTPLDITTIGVTDTDTGDPDPAYGTDGDVTITVSLVDTGTETLSTDAGTLATSGGGAGFSGVNTFTFAGTLTAVNQALSDLTYSPAENFNGDVDLLLETDDGGNLDGDNALIGALTDKDSYTITVNAVNDLPEVVLTSPASDADIYGREPTLSFDVSDVEGDNVDWTLQVSDQSDYSNIVYTTAATASSGSSVDVTVPGGNLDFDRYFWRVQGDDADTGTPVDYINDVPGDPAVFDLLQSELMVEIVDNDPGDSDDLGAEASEDAGNVGVFRVFLSPASNEDVLVNLDLAGTASNAPATDYNLSAGNHGAGYDITLTAASGSSSTVTLTPVDDNIDEADPETVTVTTANASSGEYTHSSDSVSIDIADNDEPPVVELVVDNSSIDEDGDPFAIVTAQFAAGSTTSSSTVTVDLDFTGTAAVTDDYTRAVEANANSGTQIAIPAGSTDGSVRVTAVQDTIDEDPDETVVVDIDSVSNGSESVATNQVTVTITDDDDAPEVELVVDNTNIDEDGAPFATVTAQFTGATTESAQDVTVTLAYTGTASNADYTAAAGSNANSATEIVIPAGDTSGTVTVTGDQDTIDEPAETVIVDIDAVTNGSEATTNQVTVTIDDDDAEPAVELVVDNVSIEEDGDPFATVTAQFTGATTESTQTVTVTLNYAGTALGGGTDYNAAAGVNANSATEIAIPAGSSSGTVLVTAVQDTIDEDPDETVDVTIDSVSNGTEDGVAQALITITDDDDAPEVELVVDNSSIDEDGDPFATISAQLAAGSTTSSSPIMVNLTFSGDAIGSGVDYTMSNTLITIAANANSGSVTMTADQDTIDEIDEDAVVDIASVTNATESSTTSQVTVTILDDDDPPVVELLIDNVNIEEDGDPFATVTAQFEAGSTTSSRDVTVTLAYTGSAESADYTAAAGTNATSGTEIVIPAGLTSGTVTVTADPDDIDESDEDVVVDIDSVANGDESGTTNQVTTTIADDDTATVAIADAALVTEGDGVFAVFTVTKSAVSEGAVQVNFSTSDGTALAGEDYTGQDSSLTWTDGEATASKDISIAIINDTRFENDGEDFTVTIALDGSPNATLGTATGTGTIDDDDTAPTVTLSIDETALSEAPDGSATFGTATLTVAVSSESGLDTIVDLGYSTGGAGAATRGTASGGGIDYIAIPDQVTIPADQLSITVSLAVEDDELAEDSEDLTVDITGVTNGTEDGTQSVTATITDDESVTVGFASATGSVAEDVVGNHTVTIEVDISGDGTPTLQDDLVVEVRDVTVAGTGKADSGDDYTAVADPEEVTFSSGTGDAGAPADPFEIDITDDGIFEGPESLDLGLTITGSVASLGTFSSTHELTITDDDQAPAITLVVAGDIAEGTTPGAGGTRDLTVQSDRASAVDITVTVSFSETSATDPEDYTVSATEVTIPGDQVSDSAIITITAEPDALDEDNETIDAEITAITGGATGIGNTEQITIIDDDAEPVVSFALAASPSTDEGDSGSTAVLVTVQLDAPSGRTVEVDFSLGGATSATEGTDFSITPSPKTLTFAAGDTTETITVSVLGDRVDESSPENVVLDLEATPTNATQGAPASHTVPIADDDETPSFNLTDTTADVDEGTPSGVVVLALDDGAVNEVVDGDLPDDTLTYAIESGNGGGYFAINSAGEIITTANTLDFEALDPNVVFNLEVSVTDLGGNTTDPTNNETITITVINVNDAPTAALNTVTLAPTVPEDTANPPGATIGSLITDPVYDDDDGFGSFSGVALISNNVSPAQGAWEFSTDGGGTWSEVGGVSDSSALVLDPAHLVRFLPATDFAGDLLVSNPDPSGTLTLRLWDGEENDQVPGTITTGTYEDISTFIGGSNGFSDNANLVDIETTVTDVNDAPVITWINNQIADDATYTPVVIAEDNATVSVPYIFEDDLTDTGAGSYTSYNSFINGVDITLSHNGGALVTSATLQGTTGNSRSIDIVAQVATEPTLITFTLTVSDGQFSTSKDFTLEVYNPALFDVCRDLPNAYSPDITFPVNIDANPNGVLVDGRAIAFYGIYDSVPGDWAVNTVTWQTDGVSPQEEGVGSFDSSKDRVLYGIFFDDKDRDMTYLVTPDERETSLYSRFNGISVVQKRRFFFFCDFVVQAVPQEDYDDWRDRRFGAQALLGESAKSGDLVEGSLNNLGAYVFGLDPTASDGDDNLPAIMTSGSERIVAYRRNPQLADKDQVDGFEFVVETSTDGTTWTALANQQHVYFSSADGDESWNVTVSGVPLTGYVRLRVDDKDTGGTDDLIFLLTPIL